jgi:alanine dehydrogenase
MPNQCVTLMSSPAAIRDAVSKADLVVGAALVPGSKAPTLVTREMLGKMKKGSVLVDVSIDQGGCFETSRETTHADPIYTLDGIVHYAVSNMPGALPRTSTLALNNATLPYAVQIANHGWKKAMQRNPEIKAGANVVNGKVTYKGVAETFGIKYESINKLL